MPISPSTKTFKNIFSGLNIFFIHLFFQTFNERICFQNHSQRSLILLQFSMLYRETRPRCQEQRSQWQLQ